MFANQLRDQGYGSFSQCLAVLAACDGDINSAKTALTKVMAKKVSLDMNKQRSS